MNGEKVFVATVQGVFCAATFYIAYVLYQDAHPALAGSVTAVAMRFVSVFYRWDSKK